MKTLEIRRKEFEIIEEINDYHWIATRKGKEYEVIDYSWHLGEFEDLITVDEKLNHTGIAHPRIYTYDKRTHVVAIERINSPTVLDELCVKNLSDDYFKEIFRANWFCKKDKFLLDFAPDQWKMFNGKLYYIGTYLGKFDENKTFEKDAIMLWVYSRELTAYLSAHGRTLDKTRLPINEGYIKKEICLKTIQFYL